MRYIDIPSKVLDGLVTQSMGIESWPFDDGRGDPYWSGGSAPKQYRWEIVVEITPQRHSSHRTRQPFYFDATDVSVGNYIADQQNGIAVQIVSILEKTTTTLRCVVEDNIRYNTFRDPTNSGNGIFSTPCSVIIFETNENGYPVVDPIPANGVGPVFYANLMSRFQNLEQNVNFLLHKPNHGFSVDDLISADPATKSFVKTDPSHPFVIGTVSYIDLGPHFFMINPIQKIDASYSQLPGNVGDVLYVSLTEPGKFSLEGQHPVLLKLRNHTSTKTVGKLNGASTTAGSTFYVNHVLCTVGGTGAVSDMIDAINEFTSEHGVEAHDESAATTALPTETYFYGEPAFDLSGGPATATINGHLVMFSTTTAGLAQYGAPYALEEDLVADINAAGIPGITATHANNAIRIVNAAGGPIEIVNLISDVGGAVFAGPNSASGLPLLTGPSSEVLVGLEAVDARAINLYDVDGTALSDFGLVSVENGVKAAAMFIEQGIRQAATYVVVDIAARDALNAMFGDQCFVQDKGNGEWGHYIRTLNDQWVKIADKDSSDTDAQTVEIEITHETGASEVIHTVSGGSRVTFVTVTVTEQFNGLNPIISVGDDEDTSRLMTDVQNDLTSLGAYSTTPSHIYPGSEDVDIKFTFDAANSTTGKAVIAISYT